MKEIQLRLFLSPNDFKVLKSNTIKNQLISTELIHFLQNNNNKIVNYCDECIKEWTNDSDALPKLTVISKLKDILLTKPQTQETLTKLIQKRKDAAKLFMQNESLLQEDSSPGLQSLVQLGKNRERARDLGESLRARLADRAKSKTRPHNRLNLNHNLPHSFSRLH